MGAREGSSCSRSKSRPKPGAPRIARRSPLRVAGGAGAAGLVALALIWAAPPPASGADASASARPLGSVTALAWSLRTPVRERGVLRPLVTFKVQKRALRLLRARNPRVSGKLVARIVTSPTQGRPRTLARVSRRVRDRGVHPSRVRRLAGRNLRLRRFVLTRRQTARVRRAGRRHRLAVDARVRYRVRYTEASAHRVTSPVRSARTTVPVGLHPRRPHGGNLYELAVSLRRVVQRVREASIACVTRDTIYQRLRSLYGTLVSGDRTGAAGLLRVWIADVNSKAAAGVLTDPEAASLETGLRAVLRRVGHGESKRLNHAPRLPGPPNCASGAARPTGGSGAAKAPRPYQAAALTAALKIAGAAYKVIRAGKALRNLKNTLWPGGCNSTSCGGDSVYDLITSDKVNFAAQTLDSLQKQLDDVFKAQSSGDRAAWARQWQIAEGFFTEEAEPVFQSSGYEVALLPLFAQYENLHLSLLQYGVLNGAKMGFTEEFIRTIEDKIANEVPAASQYTTDTFAQAVHNAKHYDDNQKQYESKNPVWVDNRIEALDDRDVWHLQDPMAYPYGDPNFRQTRMIYSDEWGRTHDSSNFPDFGLNDATGDLTNPPMPNIDYPLSRFTAWLKQEFTKSYDPNGDYRNFLDAIKVDNAPLDGPITGDIGLTGQPARFPYDIGPGSAIVEVGATWAYRSPLYPQHIIQVLKLYFSDGSSKIPGNEFEKNDNTGYWSYPDEVLATAKIMGRYEWGKNDYTGNAIVFGFRFDDSFASPSPPTFGRVTPQTNNQVCLAIEQHTLQGDVDYPHNGEQTGMRYNHADGSGPEVQMYDCNYAGWKGTAPWETSWSFDNAASNDPHNGELTVFGGTKCAAPDPGDPSAVRLQDCNGTGPQLWTPGADGTIINAQSGRCLESSGLSNGNPVRLNTCTYVSTPTGSTPVATQRWSWPAGWPAQAAGG
jgi:hypothetical protein